jgi:hypothetical protein
LVELGPVPALAGFDFLELPSKVSFDFGETASRLPLGVHAESSDPLPVRTDAVIRDGLFCYRFCLHAGIIPEPVETVP